MGSACAGFEEKEKGSIPPGKLGELVLLSDDIFQLDPKKIYTNQFNPYATGTAVPAKA